MKRPPLFGSRLYNQIVYPLLAASIVVGVVATLVAVYFLSDLTNKWVEQVAVSSLNNIVTRYDSFADQMQRVARFAASDPELVRSANNGDAGELNREIASQHTTLGYDNMMVLDKTGAVVAAAGPDAGLVGSRPFGTLEDHALSAAHIGIYEVQSAHILCAMQPISGTDHALLAYEYVDDGFLAQLGGTSDSAFGYYDSEGDYVASTIGKRLNSRVGRGVRKAAEGPNPAVVRAIDEAKLGGEGRESVSVGGMGFEVRAKEIGLPGNSPHAGENAFLVGLVSQRVSEEASRTTTNLIMMWSIVAVVALVGLGGWVARRVSDPLVELSAGARRIADGDFETKVDIEGANEISELAETFNEMTDSLRERSETLTKKVLELATLYEMSRALGSTLDLDELLGSVLDSAMRIFDLDLGYVALRDRDSGTVTIRAIRTDDANTDGALRSSMSEWVVREGRPLIFNPEAGTRSPQIDTVTGARAALCVPLISQDGTIGSVTIGSSDSEYRFNSDDVRLLSTIANHVTIAIGNIELFTSLQEAYLATVRSLAAAVDAKDSYTRGHSERVATYATMIGERMGLSHEQRIALEMAAYLHDIGKIGVKEEILLKPGRLDDGEMAQMRHHPLIGANILKPVAFPWAITPVVRHHHESFDGTGYPAGLRGDEIPLLARILTVADSFEAMTADRPYRKGRSPEEAIEELKSCAGTQFDPRVVDAFTQVIEELEQEADQSRSDSGDDVMPEETRAIFAALVDGLFGSFRRLGGPRLASNVETEIDEFVASQGMPFRIVRGRVSFTEDAPELPDTELELMNTTLRRIEAAMARVSGGTLVEHFFSDALESMSARMRYLARVLDFYTES